MWQLRFPPIRRFGQPLASPITQDDCDDAEDLCRRPLADDDSDVVYDHYGHVKDTADEAGKEEEANESEEEKSVRKRDGFDR